MALNQAHYNGGVLIHSGEWIILYCDGVEMGFEGSDEVAMKGKKKGRLYLTSHRVIFTSKDLKDALQSFSMPFSNLGSVDIDQPVFGANAIKGSVKSLPGGNWNGQAKFRLTFSHGGAIEFGQAMVQAAKLASRNPPPPYSPPYTSPAEGGNFYHPQPKQYMSEDSNINGFVPPKDKFPTAPPAGEVWMTDQPPPYASIYPQIPQQQQQQYNPYGAPAPAAGYAMPAGYAAPYPPAGAAYVNTAPPPTYQGNYPQQYPAGSYPSAPPPYQEKQ
ncbi:WW domain-binding protein 2-like [Paramacrobiotus metropolitanus]|uniref:WW domain-binding protein 2-like n=1 Tax=Paramacrobiotus metropolitanus TaxID=2943436 RepID=UPI0024461A8A|nr:WW domain-binding protein 2-like [Paramacrobiotus metropolitanus]